MSETTMVVRLLLGAVLGALVGIDRERSHKVAGLRTHTLVALGSSLFAILSLSGFIIQPGVNYDPLRIVSNIVVGIGFIGAGSILRRGDKVEGTTTAASLWTVAAVGASCGLGLYFPAIFTSLLVYLILTILWQVEKKITSKVPYRADEEAS